MLFRRTGNGHGRGRYVAGSGTNMVILVDGFHYDLTVC